MDPTTALDAMRDESNDTDERIDAGLSLLSWLRHGGFIPAGLGVVGYSGQRAASAAAVRIVVAELNDLYDAKATELAATLVSDES